MRCPRCAALLGDATSVGPGVMTCTCGVFFVTNEARLKLLAWLQPPIDESTWAMVLDHGRKGPTCACGAAMKTAKLKAIEVDGCASCGGLLLDPGELRKLTGLDEGARATATATGSSSPSIGIGREFAPARQAVSSFVTSSRAFHLLQVKSQVGGAVVGLPVNQPFQWTMSNGMQTGTIEPDDESTARQLLAFVTRNLVSSRFVLRDGRDNPMLAMVRRTSGLVQAALDVHYADDDALVGTITKGVVGLSLDLEDARGAKVLRFEKRLGDVWGFTVANPAGVKVGDVTRGFGNVEMDMTLLGGFDMERSVRRDDFHLTFEPAAGGVDVDVAPTAKALAVAATFLVAHTSFGPAGLTSLFN